jgi:hypothetical protein
MTHGVWGGVFDQAAAASSAPWRKAMTTLEPCPWTSDLLDSRRSLTLRPQYGGDAAPFPLDVLLRTVTIRSRPAGWSLDECRHHSERARTTTTTIQPAAPTAIRCARTAQKAVAVPWPRTSMTRKTRRAAAVRGTVWERHSDTAVSGISRPARRAGGKDHPPRQVP